MHGGGFHHLHKRKRISQHLESYPSRSAFKRVLDYLIYGAAIIAPAFLFPQVLRVYATHEVSNLSVISWSMLGLINLLWCVYGIAHREMPIFISNAAFAALNFAIVAAIFMF